MPTVYPTTVEFPYSFHPSKPIRGRPNVENKHLEWINLGKDTETDKDLLEDFATWTRRRYPNPVVALTVRDGWESIDWNTVYH